MLNFIAPSGTPIRVIDLLRWIRNFTFSKNNVDRLKKAICERFGVRHCILFGTGRTGMAFLLKILYELDDKKRNEVIIPSYTCYSVPASAEFAGLKVRIMDINPHTFDYDYDLLKKTDCKNVLAIISANLYGIPNDLERLEQFAKTTGIFFIDDAAQAMGAKTGGRFVGTFGDAGLFSLDKGKNITCLDGGVVITNSDSIAGKLYECTTEFKKDNILQKFIYFFKVLFYKLFLHPSLYWIPNRLPFLNLGKTIYDPRMPLKSFEKLQAALGIEMLHRLDSINADRISRAVELKRQLNNMRNLIFLDIKENSNPVYLRLPILTKKETKINVICSLNKAGIGATGSYPDSIYNIPEVKPNLNTDLSHAENGIHVAEEILTLPVHPYLSKKHLMVILRIFQVCLK